MPSYLDLSVIGVVLISAVLSMIRGFTREVLAIVSWIAAIAAAYYLHPFVSPPRGHSLTVRLRRWQRQH